MNSPPTLHKFLKDLGYGSTYSSNVIYTVLEQLSIYPGNSDQLTVEEVADCLKVMALTHSGLRVNPSLTTILGQVLDEGHKEMVMRLNTWNVELFFTLICKMNPSIEWCKILAKLDSSDFELIDFESVEVVVKATNAVLGDQSLFPTSVFLNRWYNRQAQIQFLTHAVQFYPDIFSNQSDLRKVVSGDDAYFSNQFIADCALNCWNCFELVLICVEYTSTATCAKDSMAILLEMGLEQAPDLFLLVVTEVEVTSPKSCGPLAQDMASELILKMINGYKNSTAILARVWLLDHVLITTSMLLLYQKDKSSLLLLFTVIQDLQVLLQILELEAFPFVIDLASLASKLQNFDLERWAQDRVDFLGVRFFHSILEYLDERLQAFVDFSPVENNATALSADIASIFNRILHLNRKIVASINQIFPQLDSQVLEGVSKVEFSPEVEAEVNLFYENVYKGELSIPEVIKCMKILQQSPTNRDQDTFKCMIHNLFDEYKFFARYPDRELVITGILFGVLIQNQIFTSMALGIALRYVLEALRQPTGSKLLQFGMQALAQFQERLAEWPQYCSLLSQIEHISQSYPEILHFVYSAQNNRNITQNELQSVQAAGSVKIPTFTALNITGILPVLTTSRVEAPPSESHDRIIFIVNNIAESNLDEKAKEVISLLNSRYIRWFCHYMVVKRAAIEPNFHSLYVDFISIFNNQEVDQTILFETLSSIKSLLNAENTVNSSQERSYLKNLGAWLGSITLAKNKPIKHKNLAFKELMMEGFELKRLIVVIPFVCKVLEQCCHSKVFNPPNPWLIAVMGSLSELYYFAELKLNLKFEIEVLCKNIKLDIKDVQPSCWLRDRIRSIVIKPEIFESLSVRDSSTENSIAIQHITNDTLDNGYPNLAQLIHFNSNISLFHTQPSLKKIVHIAIDRSIHEVIQSPVVERSVTIAIVATREIVIKDFSTESSEGILQKAAQLMVKSLAGSLASVSSREPLKVSMISNLRSLLTANGFHEQTVPDQMIFAIVSDNLDLACSIMENAAAEKSLSEIDKSLVNSYSSRRLHNESRSSQPYCDSLIHESSRNSIALPDALQQIHSDYQMQVYKDFSLIAQTQPPANDSRRIIENLNQYPPTTGVAGITLLSTSEVMEKFRLLMIDLDILMCKSQAISLDSLSSTHKIKVNVQNIFRIISQATNPDECCLLFSEKITYALYLQNTDLSRELYTFALRKLLDYCQNLSQELKSWFLGDNIGVAPFNKEKLDARIYITILRANIITIQEVDSFVSRCIGLNFQPSSLGSQDFAIDLITLCCLQDPAICKITEFLKSTEIMRQLILGSNSVDRMSIFIDSIDCQCTVNPIYNVVKKDELDIAEVRQISISIFYEWVEIFTLSSLESLSQQAFISKVRKTNKIIDSCLLCHPQAQIVFFRSCIEASVRYSINRPTSGDSKINTPIDAFARLMVRLIQHHVDASIQSQGQIQLNLAMKLLSILTLIIVNAHVKLQSDFDQKPFHRLLSSLLNELAYAQSDLRLIYLPILSGFMNVFHELRPALLPRFTFSWVKLISHRNFMPILLSDEAQKHWNAFHVLLVDYLLFLNPLIKNKTMTNSARLLYRATLRILLAILHDFPEFLSGYCHSLTDTLPLTCIQLRNLILSAFPPDMKLPDPFTPNLKVDLLPEIHQSPRILSPYTQALFANNLLKDLDNFLRSSNPATFLSTLKSLLFSDSKTSNHGAYDASKINALVLYIGEFAIQESQASRDYTLPPYTQTPAMAIYSYLLTNLDAEGKFPSVGRYVFIGAIANQLRYPNSHTHYFSCVLLYLFTEAKKEFIQEQITRVLIERLIVSRPHPYGLLITFIELIRNPRYNFWENSNFIRSAPEIERLFQNVAKSMSHSMPVPEQLISA